ncbi:MAG: ribosome rescue protein RqcH [Candidatus Hodarchaeales archaeon]|jgi:predicted ribosome quality control (RQC) complex YloA/Tae2 family protein
MKKMSSLDIFAIIIELKGIIGYRVDNLYRDSSDRFFLFNLKGKGIYRNPYLLIEPGTRIHISEFKHSVPERPEDKIIGLKAHLKGAIVKNIKQIDFDRLVEIELTGKQKYRVIVELFGNKPNFVVVGNDNKVIFASWYKKMRHRDVLPGKEFILPPSRGEPILSMSEDTIKNILSSPDNSEEEIVRVLARKTGGGGVLMEEILARANIPKIKLCNTVNDEDIQSIVSFIKEITEELEELSPSVSIDSDERPVAFQPIIYESNKYKIQKFDTFSSALDFFYSHETPVVSPGLSKSQRKREQYEKVMYSQQETLDRHTEKQKLYKEIGDAIYLHLSDIDEMLSTIFNARKKNVSWEEIISKLVQAKEDQISSVRLLEKINPKRGTITLNLDFEIIEIDFRKNAAEIANDYYKKSKKAGRKIIPAENAILETKSKIESLNENIDEQVVADAIILKRRKRSWFEKYHWTFSTNGFLIIGGRDISTNDEIAKRRMKNDDLFFHADVQGAPYTIIIRESSDEEISEEEIQLAARLAASYSSAWKAGYSAIDVYYVNAENVGFSAPSGEYLPKGGIMVRGKRSYMHGTILELAIGYEESEFNIKVIYGSPRLVSKISPVTVLIKPGNDSKGKIAKQIQKIFFKKATTAKQKAKLKALDLNEIVQAVPHNSRIFNVENTEK